MILCGLVWFIIAHYTNVCLCKVSNGLVWLCMVFYGLMHNFCACWDRFRDEFIIK